MNRDDKRSAKALFKTLQSEGERRGMSGDEINKEAHSIMDEKEKRMPTLREWYKDMIFDRFFPKKFGDLVFPNKKK